MEKSNLNSRRYSITWWIFSISIIVLLFFSTTIPAFQEEKAVMKEVDTFSSKRKFLECMRKNLSSRKEALQKDPQAAKKLLIELESMGFTSTEEEKQEIR